MPLGNWSYTRSYEWLIKRIAVAYKLETYYCGESYDCPPLLGIRDLSKDEIKFLEFVRTNPIKAWVVFKALYLPIHLRKLLVAKLDGLKYAAYENLFDANTLSISGSSYFGQDRLLTTTFELIRKNVDCYASRVDELTFSILRKRLFHVIRHGRQSLSDAEKLIVIDRLVSDASEPHPFYLRRTDYLLLARLYIWWVYERPARPNPDVVTRHRELLQDFHDAHLASFHETPGQRALILASEERSDMWSMYEAEDAAMLELALTHHKKLDL